MRGLKVFGSGLGLWFWSLEVLVGFGVEGLESKSNGR